MRHNRPVPGLKTTDIAKARALAAVIDAEIDLAIEAVRQAMALRATDAAGLPDAALLSIRDKLRSCLAAHVRSRIGEDRADRVRFGGVPSLEGELFTDDLEARSDALEDRSPAAELGDLLRTLKAEGVDVAGASVAELSTLAGMLSRGKQAAEVLVYHDRKAEHEHGLLGTPSQTSSRSTRAEGLDLLIVGETATNGAAIADSRPLRSVVEAYIKDRQASIAGHASVWKAGRSTVERINNIRQFSELIGNDRMVDTITVDELREWVGSLGNLVKARMVKALFVWALKRDWLERNPFDRIELPKGAKTGKRHFTLEELRTVFSPALIEAQRHGRAGHTEIYPWRYWVPALQVCHSLRGGEALGLRVADFRWHGRDLAFDVTEANDPTGLRRLKTSTSERSLVVHPALMERGFGKFLKALPKDGWLFPNYVGTNTFAKAAEALRADPNCDGEGRWTPNYSNWFTRYMLSAGVEPKGLSPHRFREIWRTRATASGLTDIQVNELGGWAPSSMAATYGSAIKAEVSATAELIARIDVSDILEKLPAYPL